MVKSKLLRDLVKLRGVLLDEEDLILYGQYNAYITSYGYVMLCRDKIKGGPILLHRLLLPTKKYVDHINGNPSDNRKANLRSASHKENLQNTPKPSNNTSGYKGVSWHKNRKVFIAQIGVDSKQIHLGTFTDAKEAALVYNKAALKFHGKFAKLNEV